MVVIATLVAAALAIFIAFLLRCWSARASTRSSARAAWKSCVCADRGGACLMDRSTAGKSALLTPADAAARLVSPALRSSGRCSRWQGSVSSFRRSRC